MRNTNKKGFTIVELVIVVAVIAILAAVLIPTFSGIIKKANESNDTQLVKNLNTAIAADVNGDKTMAGALAAAAEFGYDIGKINAKASGNEILWDSVNNVFCYLKDNAIEYIPEFPGAKDAAGADYWVIDNEVNDVYSTYLVDYEGESVEAKHSLDVTACGAVDVTYAGSANVSIFTNGGSLTVNGGAVTHYGNGKFLTVADGASYTEKGTMVINVADVEAPSTEVTWVEVATEEELIAALENGGYIILTADIAVENDITTNPNAFVVSKDTEINLNGHSVTGTHSYTPHDGGKSNALISVNMNNSLTLSGYGTLELTHVGTDMGWNAYSSVISVGRSTLTIGEGVVVQHNGGTAMAYAIDVLTNTGSEDATLVMNGGLVVSPYRAIRGFCNSTTGTVNITINGGIVRSTNNNAIWIQDTNTKVNKCVLTITGGLVDSEVREPIYVDPNGEFDVTVNVTGGSFMSKGAAVTGESIFRK